MTCWHFVGLCIGASCCCAQPLAERPTAPARSAQYPSPMVEHTRGHPRLKEEQPPGLRHDLSIGTLFVPDALRSRETLPLLIHFHGGHWIPQVAADRRQCGVVISLQLGSGSKVYADAFAESDRFQRWLHEAQQASKLKFEPIVLSAWSAGYGAVRAILRQPPNYERVRGVLLLDGLHAGYRHGKPGPLESELVDEDLEIFVKFARDAIADRKQLIVTHSEIFPGTFASSTETTDYLLRRLEVPRTAVLKWGPIGTQQLSEARRGSLLVAGYAGNSAPDHVDQLHALPDFLKWIDWNAR